MKKGPSIHFRTGGPCCETRDGLRRDEPRALCALMPGPCPASASGPGRPHSTKISRAPDTGAGRTNHFSGRAWDAASPARRAGFGSPRRPRIWRPAAAPRPQQAATAPARPVRALSEHRPKPCRSNPASGSATACPESQHQTPTGRLKVPLLSPCGSWAPGKWLRRAQPCPGIPSRACPAWSPDMAEVGQTRLQLPEPLQAQPGAGRVKPETRHTRAQKNRSGAGPQSAHTS